MKRIQIFIYITAVVIVSILLTACEPHAKKIHFKSYIYEYLVYDSDYMDIWTYDIEHRFVIIVSIIDRIGSYKHRYAFDSEGRNKEIYDSLCTAHNDTSLYETYYYGPDPSLGWLEAPIGPRTMLDKFSKIEVYCDKDYDGHKAGELLNDLITIRYFTNKPAIDTEYRDREWVKSKKLSELGEEDLYLMRADDNSIDLIFKTFPEDSTTFTVNLYDENGLLKKTAQDIWKYN